MRPLSVIALGNPVMSDDGLGPHVLAMLKEQAWPTQVRFLDASVSSLSFAEILKSSGRIILIDAMHGGHRPGTVYRLRADRLSLPSESFSLHDIHILHLAARFYPHRLKEITVCAVEPATLAPGLMLSRKVRAALPLLLRLVNAEINNLLTCICPKNE